MTAVLDRPLTLTESTQAEYDTMLAAGCEPITPDELAARAAALGYRLTREVARGATGEYVNRLNGRPYRTLGVTFEVRAVGGKYGTRDRWVSFAHVDAPRDRLAALQELRHENVVVFHRGRVWEL